MSAKVAAHQVPLLPDVGIRLCIEARLSRTGVCINRRLNRISAAVAESRSSDCCDTQGKTN